MSARADDLETSRIDRTLGWLIALGGCIVILDQTVFRVSDLANWAPWWNVGSFIVVAGIVVLAGTGLVLPTRALKVAWVGLPILYTALQATWVIGYRGPDLAGAVPWLWTVEPAIVTLTLLVLRPALAVVSSLLISSTPALASLIILGTIPPGVGRETPNQLGSVIYVVIFIGVRLQFQRLSVLEQESRVQHRRQLRAAALVEQHTKLARMVHDEVLSVLSTAMKSSGQPPDVLRRAAERATAALRDSAEPLPKEGESLDTHDAAAAIEGHLAHLDDRCMFETHLVEGTLRRDVVGGLALATAEALRNSLRHAGPDAERVVILDLSDERALVTVVDNGVGFHPAAARTGLGIPESIESRMSELGGAAVVESEPGRGTKVILTWPG